MKGQPEVQSETDIPSTEHTPTADGGGSSVLSRSFSPPAEADWHRMISEAAYYLAAKRNFAPGADLNDWLEAEAAAKDFLSPH